MFGILNLNKPAGVTSRDVVNRVQRLVRPAKVGHAGTLDPLATGVLVVCIGPATRLIEYVQRMPKRYLGAFLLGRRSDTEDVDGNVEALADPPRPTRQQIEIVLPQFIGQIEQRPPAFSALKVAGRRAYDLARKGKPVELEPRVITVYSIAIERYDYPELVLDIECGSGTYVRSLGRDIAESLGTAAVMSQLERTAIGGFRVEDACDVDQLSRQKISDDLLPPQRAVASLPTLVLSDAEFHDVANGRTIKNPAGLAGEEIAALDADGRLTAILVPRGVGKLGPARFFPSC